MAKKKPSVEDLDAELAAVEAELAALEGRPVQRKAKPKEPARAPPPEAPPAEEADETPAPKRRFGLPFGKKDAPVPVEKAAAVEPAQAPAESTSGGLFGKARRGFGRKSEPAAAPEPEPIERPAEAPAPEPEPEPPVAHAPAKMLPVTDASVWRHEGHAWVRTVDNPQSVTRRILDEDGETIREEPATQADLDEVTGVKAERGLKRLFGRKGAQ